MLVPLLVAIDNAYPEKLSVVTEMVLFPETAKVPLEVGVIVKAKVLVLTVSVSVLSFAIALTGSTDRSDKNPAIPTIWNTLKIRAQRFIM